MAMAMAMAMAMDMANGHCYTQLRRGKQHLHFRNPKIIKRESLREFYRGHFCHGNPHLD